MEEIKEQIKGLLDEVKADEFQQYHPKWQAQAVQVMNDYAQEVERWDDMIYDTTSDEWDEITKSQVEQRGWQGLMYFLAGLTPTTDYAYIDAYGNAQEARIDAGYLNDILDEMGEE